VESNSVCNHTSDEQNRTRVLIKACERLALEEESLPLGFREVDHKNYNFLDCDWFKKLLFSTNSLAKLLSDNLLSDNLLLDSSISQSHSNCGLNQPITFKVVV